MEKGHILRPSSGLATTKMKTLSKHLRVVYVSIYIQFIYIYPKVAIFSLWTVCPCSNKKLVVSYTKFSLFMTVSSVIDHLICIECVYDIYSVLTAVALCAALVGLHWFGTLHHAVYQLSIRYRYFNRISKM